MSKKRPADDSGSNLLDVGENVDEEVGEPKAKLRNVANGNDESDSDSASESDSSTSSSGSSSSSSSSSSDEDSGDEAQTDPTAKDNISDENAANSSFSECPLQSLISSNVGRAYSPLAPASDYGKPVDPVFVDEESSGEAAASAADQDNVDLVPPLNPPLPIDEAPKRPEEPPGVESSTPAKEISFDVIDELPPVQRHTDAVGGGREDEDDGDEDDDDDDDESIPEDEIHALIEANVQETKDEEENVNHIERTKFRLIEKGVNHFDVLPRGWVKVMHASGMPVYLHKFSRVVSLTKPYVIGRASARRHHIPIGSIPCLNYKKAVEREEANHAQSADAAFPVAKVESIEETSRREAIDAEQYREYCSKLFKFREITVKKFQSWTQRRQFFRQAQKKKIQEVKKSVQSNKDSPVDNESPSAKCRPSLPEGTQIISIPVVELEQHESGAQDNPLKQKVVRKARKDWLLNPAGKSTVCILHEYLQHSLRKQPVYKYQEMDSAATPYSAVVEVNGLEYGRGVGSSKKEAKSEAARITLEILIPEFKGNLNSKNGYVIKDTVDLSFFDNIRIEDPRVADLCNRTSEPSPYAILLSCLQRNYGLGDTSIKTEMVPGRNKRCHFFMRLNDREVSAVCRNKRDGKQMASQKLLQLLHPHIKSWGSLLRMYGSHAINAQKNKKARESEVTALQSQVNNDSGSPNAAILAKLRQEMHALAERKKSITPIGKLTVRSLPTGMGRGCIDRISL